ncbi:MAG TPA: hypothetical protein VOB72_08250 [Candidatus Dormibacteraeota bacterium]|nr:hypothetical protein [Candidatus Dormibacteraeota bacterium]
MTTTQEPRPAAQWPKPPRHIQPSPSARTLTAYLSDRPVRATAESDACLRTHVQVRIAGSDIVHRLADRSKTFYVTGCGSRIAKTDGVLTAGGVDCRHQGCGVTA